jgi:hypothetical protein
MDEFKFVMKCFMFATAIVLFSQMKTKDGTLENKAEMFLQDSPTAHFIQQSAEGGAKVLNQTFQTTKSFLKRKMAQAGGSVEPTESND